VRDNGGFKLAPERVTLAEVLKAHGWATGGFIAAYVLDHRWGIAQGFDRYFDDFDLSKYKTVSMGDIQRRGDEVLGKALEWMSNPAVREKPFFAWVHLYDPHAPYTPPEPFASRYAGHPYNGEIAWTDSLVGQLLAGLDRLGVRERTVLAIIGDHGESLGEHGETGHGFFLYEPTTRVPFLLAGPYPGLRGKRVRPVVRHVDLMPTLLELLGVKDGPPIQGRSLVPLITGRSPTSAGSRPSPPQGYSEAFYARFHYGWSELRAVRTERYHFIEAPRAELYDLATDPGEIHNLAATERRTVAALRKTLGEIEQATGPAQAARAPIEEDEETLRKLSALGYVGSTAKTEGKSWRDLPDPKDRIRVYNLMDRAREEAVEKDPDGAIATLNEILKEDPEVIDAWFMLGNAYFQKHDWERAADYYKKTLVKRPDHDYAMIGLADTLVSRNRIDDAVLGYRSFLERDPDNAQITYRLAQVLLDAGRNGDAERSLRRTLAIEPKTARAQVGLAVLAYRKKDFAGARQEIARALAIDPKARYARYKPGPGPGGGGEPAGSGGRLPRRGGGEPHDLPGLVQPRAPPGARRRPCRGGPGARPNRRGEPRVRDRPSLLRPGPPGGRRPRQGRRRGPPRPGARPRLGLRRPRPLRAGRHLHPGRPPRRGRRRGAAREGGGGAGRRGKTGGRGAVTGAPKLGAGIFERSTGAFSVPPFRRATQGRSWRDR